MNTIFLIACLLTGVSLLALLLVMLSVPRHSAQRRTFFAISAAGIVIFGAAAIAITISQPTVRDAITFGRLTLALLILFAAALLVIMAASSASLRSYILTRLLLTLPMVLILVTLVFFVLRVLPGDPVTSKLAGRISEAQKQSLLDQLGLNQPITTQYLDYLGKIARLDFGVSLVEGRRPILDELAERLPATIELTLPAFVLTLLIGILPGALAAHKHRTPIDHALRLTSIVTYAIPVFWLGLMMQLVFSIKLGWTPIDHRIDPIIQTTFRAHTNLYLLDTLMEGNLPAFFSAIHHLILPVTALAIILSGVFVRLTRVNMIETMQQDFVMAARARGVPERTIIYRHTLRNAFIPTLTLIGLQFAILLAGAVLTETTFSWPGMGLYLVERISARDYTAVQGAVTVFALFVAFTSLAVDVIYGFVDPRIRY